MEVFDDLLNEVGCPDLERKKKEIEEYGLLISLSKKNGLVSQDMQITISETIDRLNNEFETMWDNLLPRLSAVSEEHKYSIFTRIFQSSFIIDVNPERVFTLNTDTSSHKFEKVSIRFLGASRIPIHVNTVCAVDFPYFTDECAVTKKEQSFTAEKCTFLRHEIQLRLINKVKGASRRKRNSDNMESEAESKSKKWYTKVVYLHFNINISSDANVFSTVTLKSFPMVIRSHPSQTVKCVATLIWHYLSLARRETSGPAAIENFIEETQSWSNIKPVLEKMYEYRAGAAPPDSQFDYLKQRLPCDDVDKVTYHEFAKKSLMQAEVKKNGPQHKLKFSLFDYFYHTWNTVSLDEFNRYWLDGVIYGYVSKEQVNHMLRLVVKARTERGEPIVGAFVIRFSENNIRPGESTEPLGYLAVSYLHPDVALEPRHEAPLTALSDKKIDLMQYLDKYMVDNPNIGNPFKWLIRRNKGQMDSLPIIAFDFAFHIGNDSASPQSSGKKKKIEDQLTGDEYQTEDNAEMKFVVKTDQSLSRPGSSGSVMSTSSFTSTNASTIIPPTSPQLSNISLPPISEMMQRHQLQSPPSDNTTGPAAGPCFPTASNQQLVLTELHPVKLLPTQSSSNQQMHLEGAAATTISEQPAEVMDQEGSEEWIDAIDNNDLVLTQISGKVQISGKKLI